MQFLSVALLFSHSTSEFLSLCLCVWSVVPGVCVRACVFWPCEHWWNLMRLPALPSLQSDLCTWFCPLTSASCGRSLVASCLTDFSWSRLCRGVSWPTPFLPGFSFSDFRAFIWKSSGQWYGHDFLLLACRNNTVPLFCLLTLLTPFRPSECSTTWRAETWWTLFEWFLTIYSFFVLFFDCTHLATF